MNLSISFKLTGAGWAECNVSADDEVAVLTASYLDDALGNLADAVLRIAQGEKSAHAVFAEEPGEYIWEFIKTSEKNVSVRIIWFDDWDELRETNDKGRIVLQFDCPLPTLIRRMIICLSETLNEYGLEGYKDKWIEHEFPLNIYNELRNILPTLK